MTILRSALMVLALGSAGAQAEVDWKPLFNGKDLDGWVQKGGKASYKVEDGAIVGTSVNGTPNSFLCTDRDYADFVLEYEFKVDSRLNSGVQIRSKCYDKDTEVVWADKVIKIGANLVHGYQVEIDPDPSRKRWWSVGIYEERTRGWLYPGLCGGDDKAFTEQGAKIFKQGDWNQVRVEAKGNSIKTWLNGELRADLIDSRVASGFIGLQVHSVSKDREGAQVSWRNLRIQDLGGLPNTLSEAEKKDGWKLLWDGKTTEGWRSARGGGFPEKGWEISDGMLVIKAKSGAGSIITREKFSDFELKLDFRLTPASNSGIKLFVPSDTPDGPVKELGPEYQVLDDALHPDAHKGKEGNHTVGSLYDLIPAPKDKKVLPVGAWNHIEIISKDNKVTFLLNGVKTVEFERGTDQWYEMLSKSKYKSNKGFGEGAGHILLQDHFDEVYYRNIKIKVTQ